MNRKHRIYQASYIVLFLITLLCCAHFCWQNGVFGSKVDWISQHSVLPEYFRTHFYETGKIFPEFALNLGGGQNIYNFSYYGLYSPLILFSYLLPFVKMSDYIMAVQFICLAASVLLMYRWLANQKFSLKISFAGALVFLLAGPMIFHSYSQIMFVNYMPFLCLALMAVDRYFEDIAKRKSGLLIVSIFLIIMTSFYFSIGAILALVVYGIYRFFRMCDLHQKKVTILYFLQEGCRFALCVIISIMMSAVLLIPTAMALAGRDGHSGLMLLSELLLPSASLERFLYSPYGIGLTTFAVTAMIAMLFFPKKHEKILAWGCVIILSIPLFAYLLNGGLYIRDKALIPFLPLMCYMMAYYADRLERVKEKKLPLIAGSLPYMIMIVWVLWKREDPTLADYWIFFLEDAVVMIICWLIFYAKRKIVCLLVPPVLFLGIYQSVLHEHYDRLLEPEFYEQITDEKTGEQIEQIVKEEEGLYRTEQLGKTDENAANLNRVWNIRQYLSSIYSSSYNQAYQDFRTDVFHLEQPFRNFLMQTTGTNPVFRKFMGIQSTLKNGKVSTDEITAPMVYATDRTASQEVYDTLNFPVNQLALLSYAVTEDGEMVSDWNKNHLENVVLTLPSKVDASENHTITMEVTGETDERERVLFISFEVDNLQRTKEVSVWINGVKNKVSSRSYIYYNHNTTFYYAIPLKEGQHEINVTLGRGQYEISDVEACIADLSQWEKDQEKLYQSELTPDWQETKDNVIAGTIDVKNDGWLVTSIPYDEHFEILIDGVKTETSVVNTAFLGCRIDQGSHEVKIIYHAPGLFAGKAVSAAGLAALILLLSLEKRKNLDKDKKE